MHLFAGVEIKSVEPLWQSRVCTESYETYVWPPLNGAPVQDLSFVYNICIYCSKVTLQVSFSFPFSFETTSFNDLTIKIKPKKQVEQAL